MNPGIYRSRELYRPHVFFFENLFAKKYYWELTKSVEKDVENSNLFSK
ncbi:MAG: hypothetical protein OEY38_08675 [Gammaproteobacteria bacterium]|nr:hypothetical protein [Gammaproteobacteria bacterium]